MPELTLTLTNYSTDREWSWELSSRGILLACHDIRVDPADPSFEAFTNIQAYVSWRASSRTLKSVKSAVLNDLGRWITTKLFGSIIHVLCDGSPTTVVNVVLPAAASHFSSWPFELAWFDGSAIAARGVIFTYEAAHARPSATDWTVATTPVRVLGIFALPTGLRPLSLRKERRQLEALFRRMSVGAGLDVRFSFIQYGVTRDRLAYVLREHDGWDIVHISAHGVAGGLALEASDSSLDIIGSKGLLSILEGASPRLKLVVLSSCSSAGAVFDRPHRQLLTPEERAAVREPSLEVPVFGSVIADRADCAVLAMRFPVPDRYATDLSLHLYRHLIEERRSLPQALRAAIADSTPGTDILGQVTPILLGSGCDRIAFQAAPLAADSADRARIIAGPEAVNLADTFIGRTEVVGRVIAALAPGGTSVAVVLYGMPGSGKTATAAEIAHCAAESFEKVVWLNLPPSDGFGQARSAHAVGHDVSIGLAADVGRRVLYVIDNVSDSDSVVMLLESLAKGDGPRLLITSSQRLALPNVGVLWERLDSLSPEESALLIGHCANLQELLAMPSPHSARAAALANNVAATAKGSPSLITLADAHAQSYERLHQWVTLLRAQWSKETDQAPGTTPVASNTTRLAQRMLEWARQELTLLPKSATSLLQIICGLEESDRLSWFVNVVSLQCAYGDGLTEELQRAHIATLNDAVEILCSRSLILPIEQGGSDEVLYAIPTVIDLAVRQGMTPRIAQDINVAAKVGWLDAISFATHPSEHERGDLVSRACQSIVPYLIRLDDPDSALHYLNLGLNREFPDASVTDALRLTEQISDVAASSATQQLAVFTRLRLLARIDPVATLREADTALITLVDQELRADVLTLKITLLCSYGRFNEALAIADEKLAAAKQHTDIRRRFDAEGMRLQVLHLLGRYEETYERAQTLWLEMDSARAALEQFAGDPYLTWNTYELILQAGAFAARSLDKYDESLAMNRARRRSMRERNAPSLWQANALYDDFLPLLKLARVQEARQVCLDVLPVARAKRDRILEASALGSLSEVELALEYVQDALRLGTMGLTMLYDSKPFDYLQLITTHNRMANIYRRLNQWPEAFIHRLACVMICMLTDSTDREEMLRLAVDLCYFRQPPLPTDAHDVTAKLTVMHSIDFAAVIDEITLDPDAVQHAYQEALAQARAVPVEELFPLQDIADIWGSAMAASAAAVRGDSKARAWLHRMLDSNDSTVAQAFLRLADGRVHEGDRSTMSP